MKVCIVTICYNINPQVFLLQVEAIRKFCKDDFVIEVIDNGSDNELTDAIRYHSERLELNYTKTNASSFNSTDSHVFALNTAYQLLKDNYSMFLFLDHDVIPVLPFSINEILKDKVMAGLGQGQKKKYFWVGLVCFSDAVDKNLIDFSFCHHFNLDSGGMLYKVIEKYGEEYCTFFNEAYHQNPNYNGKYNKFSMLNNGMFMHFINSSGWNPTEDNEARINSLINIAREKIDEYVD